MLLENRIPSTPINKLVWAPEAGLERPQPYLDSRDRAATGRAHPGLMVSTLASPRRAPIAPSLFNKTVAALTESIVDQQNVSDPPNEMVAAVTAFVLATQAGMPDYLRVGMRALTLGFSTWSYAFKGRPFYQLTTLDRAAQIDAWEGSRLNVRSGLLQFYRTFVTFGLYSECFQRDYDVLPARVVVQ